MLTKAVQWEPAGPNGLVFVVDGNSTAGSTALGALYVSSNKPVGVALGSFTYATPSPL